MERYGHGTPDDWLERNVYARYSVLGLSLMGAIDIALFGLIPGALILIVQIAWIPFWAAGVINGIGHYWGYRNWDVQRRTRARNIVAVGHPDRRRGAAQQPPRLSDLGQVLAASGTSSTSAGSYIRMLESLGLATVKKVAPTPRFSRPEAGRRPADAAGGDRQSLRRAGALRHVAQAHLRRGDSSGCGTGRRGRRSRCKPAEALARARAAALPEPSARSSAKRCKNSKRARDGDRDARRTGRAVGALDRLARAAGQQLQDWCHRAEASGIAPLVRVLATACAATPEPRRRKQIKKPARRRAFFVRRRSRYFSLVSL